MKTSFTKSTANFGCYVKEGNIQDKYLKKENFTIKDILKANVSLKDKAWFIRKNCELNEIELKEFAIGCALCVLPIFEKKYPNDKAPRKAIEVAKYYLDGKVSIEELNKSRDDAYAAAYAAYAADDADDAAAYAAYAADDAAAYAAYAAADAAADAADAAAAYAADINYKEILLNFFKEFTLNKKIK